MFEGHSPDAAIIVSFPLRYPLEGRLALYPKRAAQVIGLALDHMPRVGKGESAPEFSFETLEESLEAAFALSLAPADNGAGGPVA
jgi:hypothetical protein